MEKAIRGASQQGTGRPQNEDATQSKVTIFLGRDKEARELKRKLDEMHHEVNQSGQLRDTVKLVLEHFR